EMFKHCLVIAGFLAAMGCEKKQAPTESDIAAAKSAQNEKNALEASKAKADEAAKVAKDKAEVAKDDLKAVDKKADELADKADIDFKGLDKSDYTVKKADDGSIVAWRKTQPVAGKGGATELKDDALANTVKTKIA